LLLVGKASFIYEIRKGKGKGKGKGKEIDDGLLAGLALTWIMICHPSALVLAVTTPGLTWLDHLFFAQSFRFVWLAFLFVHSWPGVNNERIVFFFFSSFLQNSRIY